MAEENIEVVRRAFIAWNTRDFDALSADSASDVEWDFSHVAGWTEKTTYRGLPELRSFWDRWLETWADHHLELLQLVAIANDKVFCRYRQTATGKASGVSVEVENAQIITFRDSKVIRTVVYSDPGEAASAAGVPA
jgi:ketosteroid isomerase-like protein